MKPLADHGTTARAKGRPEAGIPGCPCRPCRDAENHYNKRRRYLNATGRTLRLPAEPIAQHLDALFEAGAGWAELSATTGVAISVMSRIRRRLQPVVFRDVATRILAAQPGDAIPPGRPVPATGSIRRIHALMAIGHRVKDIEVASGVEHSLLSSLVNEHLTTVSRHVAERLTTGYDKLSTTPGTCARSRNRAIRHQWAPPAAWDEGTLDDPDAAPDWTGHCGTDNGWWQHSALKLPACARCEDAHQQWRQEHKHLPPARRAQALARARTTAVQRGAGIAEDARELLRQGYDRAQAAERLGLERGHLDRALSRYPEGIAA